jgi:hypothetical protein
MLAVPRTMEAIRLTIDTPSLQLGEPLVEVHATIRRDERSGLSTGSPLFPRLSRPEWL